jgi:hypothetical protein
MGVSALHVTYEIQVLEVDRPDWRIALRDAVAEELRDIGAHRAVEVRLVDGARRLSDVPAVSVVLSGPGAVHDVRVADGIRLAISEGLVVFPVVDDLAGFASKVPADLSPFNGFAWDGPDPARRLARLLLEGLGIEEADRRVFISHRRSDGLWAAEQLHDELSHHGFRPFIDRFGVPKGADVQTAIADALEDFAFLLLLETPDAHTSPWVFDEVDYALSHTMGIVILQWPGSPPPVPGSAFVPRLRLRRHELRGSGLRPDPLHSGAVDGIVREVEAAHARGIVRRRRMLLQNVQEAALLGGATCTPLRSWALDVSAAGHRTIVHVAPRLPTASDVQRLDEARVAVDPSANGVLVHAARVIDDERQRHLDWLTRGRRLQSMPDNRIGGLW